MSLESLNLQNTQNYYTTAEQRVQNPFAREYNQIEDTYQNYDAPKKSVTPSDSQR